MLRVFTRVSETVGVWAMARKELLVLDEQSTIFNIAGEA